MRGRTAGLSTRIHVRSEIYDMHLRYIRPTSSSAYFDIRHRFRKITRDPGGLASGFPACFGTDFPNDQHLTSPLPHPAKGIGTPCTASVCAFPTTNPRRRPYPGPCRLMSSKTSTTAWVDALHGSARTLLTTNPCLAATPSPPASYRRKPPKMPCDR